MGAEFCQRLFLHLLRFHFSLSCIGEANGNPLQCSCLENPRDGGAWWAAVYGVAQSWTRLKWLSSSSSSIEIIMWFLSFNLLIWCITLIDLCILKNPWIPEINPTCSWCMSFLMCCWILFAKILLRIFASMFINTSKSSYTMITLGLFKGCKDSSIYTNQCDIPY